MPLPLFLRLRTTAPPETLEPLTETVRVAPEPVTADTVMPVCRAGHSAGERR